MKWLWGFVFFGLIVNPAFSSEEQTNCPDLIRDMSRVAATAKLAPPPPWWAFWRHSTATAEATEAPPTQGGSELGSPSVQPSVAESMALPGVTSRSLASDREAVVSPVEDVPLDPAIVKLFSEGLAAAYAQDTTRVRLSRLLRGVGAVEWAKPYRFLVVGTTEDLPVPREFSEQIEDELADISENIFARQAELRSVAEVAGEAYLPQSERLLIQVLGQVSAYVRTSAGPRVLLRPIIDFINDTNRSFKRLLSLFNKVNRYQAELLTLFLELKQMGVIDPTNPQVQLVFRDLAVKNVISTTLPLHPETVNRLRFISRLPLEGIGRRAAAVADDWNPLSRSGRISTRYRSSRELHAVQQRLVIALDRLVAGEEQMRREGVYYGIRFHAYVSLCQRLRELTQPDGDDRIEMGSLLLGTIDSGLEDFPALRDFYLSLYARRGRLSFEHPTLKTLERVEGDVAQIFHQRGGLETDPILSGIITDDDKMRRVHARVLLWALETELQETQELLSAQLTRTELQRLKAKTDEVSRRIISQLRPVGMLGMSSQSIKNLAELFVLPEISDVNAPTSGGTEPITADEVSVPLVLPQYLDTHLTAHGFGQGLFKDAREFALSRNGATDKPFAEGGRADATVYFAKIVKGLAEQSQRIQERDLAEQAKAWDQGQRSVAHEVRRDLEQQKLKLQRLILKVWAALRESLLVGVNEQKAEELATLLFCRYVETEPGLGRAFLRSTLPGLNRIGNELVLREMQRSLGSSRILLPRELVAAAQSEAEVSRQNGVTRRQMIWRMALTVGATATVTTAPQWYPWLRDRTWGSESDSVPEVSAREEGDAVATERTNPPNLSSDPGREEEAPAGVEPEQR